MDAILEMFTSLLGDVDYAELITILKTVITYLSEMISSLM